MRLNRLSRRLAVAGCRRTGRPQPAATAPRRRTRHERPGGRHGPRYPRVSSDSHPICGRLRSTTARAWHRWTRLLLTGPAAVVVGVVLTAAVSSPAAHAQTTEVVALAATFHDLLNNLRNWIMGVLASVATAFLTVGGARYLLAAGDPAEVQRAKTALKSAAIGYVLTALAPLIVAALQTITGGP